MATNIISMFCSSLAAFILGLVLSPSLMSHGGDPQRADAAFSDGLFQATLDFQSGRRPHLASGRWSADRDRLSFTNGYQQRWRELFKNSASTLPMVDDAQLSGYWDGVVEGTKDGRESQPYKVGNGNTAQAVASSHSAAYNDAEKQHYLDGYASGYKAGYSSQHEMKTIASSRD